MNQVVEKVNVVSSAFKANPFPYYASLRAEAPVYRIVMPDKQAAWLITRYDDVAMVLKDEQHFVKDRRNAMTPEQLAHQPWIPGFFNALSSNLLDTDAPDHTRLRGLVHKAFTPRLIEQMRARIDALANELIDAVEHNGEMELIRDFALPLPLTIITELLGVPTKDTNKFHRWSKSVVSASSGTDTLRVIPTLWFFINYLKKLFKERRQHPGDDLLTALIQAEEAGDQLSEDELLAMVFVLLIAGHETTVNLIASGMLALLEYPDQMVKLRNDPSLIKSAVEELLRFTCPIEMATERYASKDVTVAGVTIPKGERVMVVIASANRDKQHFENPDVLDITRENNKHLGFGQGAHYCLGAPLARLEGQIAINTLLRRLPNLRLKGTSDSLRWRSGMVLRGLEALPVTF